MKVKLKSLGQKEKDAGLSELVKSPSIERFPELNISSSQLEGMTDATLGKKCKILLEAEVIELRKPSEWEVKRGEGKSEVLGRFKLLKGAILPMSEKKAYGDLDDVVIAAKKESGH